MRGLFGVLMFTSFLWGQNPQQIRVSVERLDGTAWKAMNPATVFATGDRVRFEVSASFDGYLYVLSKGTSGGYDLLFPRGDTGRDNRIEAKKGYFVPAVDGGFRITGPAGQDVVYWLVSPVDLGKQYRPLPPAPEVGKNPAALPASMKPRCDDLIFKARGECIDHSAGMKPVADGEKLPENMKGLAGATPREMVFIQNGDGNKESVVISSPAPLTGPVVYELRLAHR